MKELIEKFIRDIKEVSGENDTAFELFFNAHESKYKVIARKKEPHVNFKNLKGEWVK